jgi:hypothetical protein
MGLAAQAQGDLDTAQELLETAVRLNSNYSAAREALAALSTAG